MDGLPEITVEGYYRKKLNRFLRYVEDSGHKQVSDDTVRSFFASLAYLKPGARATYLRSLKTFFNWMMWEKVIAVSPVAEARIRIHPQKKIKVLPGPEEVTRALIALRRACYGTKDVIFDRLRDLCMVHFVLETGLRRSELTRMTIGATDLEKARAIFAGKNRDERVVHFPYSREAMRFYQEECLRRFGKPREHDAFWLNKWGAELQSRSTNHGRLYVGFFISLLGYPFRIQPHLAHRYGSSRRDTDHFLPHRSPLSNSAYEDMNAGVQAACTPASM